VLKTPALVAGLDDVAMVGEAVEERGGHLRIAEYAQPARRKRGWWSRRLNLHNSAGIGAAEDSVKDSNSTIGVWLLPAPEACRDVVDAGGEAGRRTQRANQPRSATTSSSWL